MDVMDFWSGVAFGAAMFAVIFWFMPPYPRRTFSDIDRDHDRRITEERIEAKVRTILQEMRERGEW